MSDLERGVATVLEDCLGVASGETVVVVTDPPKRGIAEALVSGARDRGCETILVEMSVREQHGTEPPRAVADAMLSCDVLIVPTTKSLSHTEARHAATQKGVRAATMPDITEDMMGRTMSADYEGIRERSRAIAARLTASDEVRITTPSGTDVSFDVSGRDGIADDGDLRAPGSFGNLPAGEGFVAPVEGRTNGRIVFDGSISPIGLLVEPLTVEVQDGYAVSFDGPRAEEYRALLGRAGPEAFAVAELGIGTNEAARLVGNTLEDEKILGSIHIAFGDNHSFGGVIRVPSHHDGIVLAPTVVLDGEVLMNSGELAL